MPLCLRLAEDPYRRRGLSEAVPVCLRLAEDPYRRRRLLLQVSEPEAAGVLGPE